MEEAAQDPQNALELKLESTFFHPVHSQLSPVPVNTSIDPNGNC